MVQRRRKIIWTVNALLTKKAIFKYWNNRNKSIVYSQKLELLFKETVLRIALLPEGSVATEEKNVRMILARDYYLIIKLSEALIKVLDVWDTRQNPENFPTI